MALSLLAKVGILRSSTLKKNRRYAVLIMFIVAAIVAPPDPLSMIMFAIPLMGLFEISVLAATWVEPKYEES